MHALNKAQIIGNLTRVPELKKTEKGQSVCTIGVATNRYWTDANGVKKDEAEFHNVVCWGKLAEICAEYLQKGTKAFFEGRLQTRSWEDEGGIKHYRTEIVAQDMIILSPKGDKSFSAEPEIESIQVKVPTKNTADSNVAPEDLPF